MSSRKALRVKDLARILGEERRRADLIRSGVSARDITTDMLADAPPLGERTIRQYVHMARAVRDGRPARKQYADNPFPLPSNDDEAGRGNYSPMWDPPGFQETRIRAWYRKRPGPGVGGGRRPADEQPATADR